MRGLYSAGVMDVLMQHGFRPDVICGTSAGVTFGVNYPSHQPGRVLRYNLKFAGDKRYISVNSLLRTGDICNVDFCYRELPDELEARDFVSRVVGEVSSTDARPFLSSSRTFESVPPSCLIVFPPSASPM